MKFTLITRLSDALPLAASMDNVIDMPDPDSYKMQAKHIFRELSMHPPPRLLTVESGNFCFHILTENDVCFLTVTDLKATAAIAFSFLEELNKEFQNLFGAEIKKCERPYQFIKFDTFLQKTKRVYADTRNSRNLRMQSKGSVTRKTARELLGWQQQGQAAKSKSSDKTVYYAIGGGLAAFLVIILLVFLISRGD
eukprot:NODE_4666_length_762_cov_58.940157_g4643_i0.p1 GENE.NODE_4666_length_762_cov_58.940157_g4643_i0~~NODE_4666_length_762_cov_58.940157_g4643_i0.p1  ORF type:complete len:219 (+),score=42.53 NODE_4666_length_762_cov_58.940157_g4643_i0:75-659(+)